jgi:SOS-response transcriptional repressor LexA
VVVTDGLKEGELVIVEGVQKVRPGQIVTANVVAQN